MMLLKLMRELERVASLNDDEFDVFIEPKINDDRVWYMLHAEESAEQHLFVSGNGWDVEKAAELALGRIPEACKSWGYKHT